MTPIALVFPDTDRDSPLYLCRRNSIIHTIEACSNNVRSQTLSRNIQEHLSTLELNDRIILRQPYFSAIVSIRSRFCRIN